jgi:hypothetical protein
MARCPNARTADVQPIFADVQSLLAAHGLTGVPEQPLTNSGYSGAALSTIARPDGERFVLKRMSIESDWIMRATDDRSCREAMFATAAPDLGRDIATPTAGVSRDGGGYALLMRDITADLLPEGAVSEAQLERIIHAMAALHRRPLPHQLDVSWCDLRRRVLLLTPAGARIAAGYGAPVADALVRGWALFEQLAPSPVAELIASLSDDPAPLLEALAPLPAALLHGDLKFDNIGIAPDGRVWLIDWAMPLLAPPTVELGWFLAINSRRLPASLDDVIERYARAAGIAPAHRARHDALTVLCGLLLRGWRKALDAAEGEPAELAWWCEHAEAAAAYL